MTLPNKILAALQGNQALSSRELTERVEASWSTVKRHLEVLLEAGKVEREKDGRTARYRLKLSSPFVSHGESIPNAVAQTPWSPESRALRASLLRPLAMREVVTYPIDHEASQGMDRCRSSILRLLERSTASHTGV